MEYIKVIWYHNFIDEPVELYYEVDYSRNELRKVELYANGAVGYASLNSHYNGSFPSKDQIPTIEDINKDNQFSAMKICKNEFEEIWIYAIKKARNKL